MVRRISTDRKKPHLKTCHYPFNRNPSCQISNDESFTTVGIDAMKSEDLVKELEIRPERKPILMRGIVPASTRDRGVGDGHSFGGAGRGVGTPPGQRHGTTPLIIFLFRNDRFIVNS